MAAVVLADLAQTDQFVRARLDAGTSNAPPLSRGTRLLNELVFSVASSETQPTFLQFSTGFGVGNEAALFDFGGFGANIRVSQVLW